MPFRKKRSIPRLTASFPMTLVRPFGSQQDAPQPDPIFPRFLDLPTELQIQVWEHAIKDTILNIGDPRFGVDRHFTRDAIAQIHLQKRGGKRRLLNIPSFYPIMQSCRLARDVAKFWWSKVMGECDSKWVWKVIDSPHSIAEAPQDEYDRRPGPHKQFLLFPFRG